MKLDIKDYRLPEELERYYEDVKEFAKTELEAIAEEIEKTNKVPSELLPILKGAGLTALTLPKEYGGNGLTFSQYWPILAEVAKPCGTIRMIPHVFNNCWRWVLSLATEEQKKEFVPYWFEGNKIFAFCLTEPDTRTGVDIKTTAVKIGNKYRINGRKHLITHAYLADIFFVVCYTGDRSLGAKGTSMLVVPRGAPGFRIEPHGEMMGLKGSPHGVLYFENCEIPVENIIGEEGEGLKIFMGPRWLDISRLSIAVSSYGPAERLLELSVEFAKRRVTFGKPIANRQAIEQMIAEMVMDIHVTRCAIEDCARKFDEGRLIPVESCACKAFATEMVGRVSDKAYMIHGGVGYTKEYPVERLYRDVRAMWFEEGSPTINKLIIARAALGKPLRSIGSGL